METEIYGDERDFEIGGAFYDGPMYAIDEDGEFDDAPEDD